MQLRPRARTAARRRYLPAFMMMLASWAGVFRLPAEPTLSADAALTRLRLQLRWDHQYQFAGYYAADWLGYYREEGLQVELLPALSAGDDGLKIASAMGELAEGRADFAIGAADALIGIDRGQDLVIASPVFQRSAAVYVAMAETPLETPGDLLKLRIARTPDDLIDIEFKAALREEGLRMEAADWLPHRPGVDVLVRGEAQAIPGYSISLPYVFAAHGLQIRTVSPAQYGISFYGDAIVARGELARRHPRVVEAFVRASLKGWAYALAHPNEIAVRIARELPRLEPIDDLLAYNAFQALGVAKLVDYPFVALGHSNLSRWQKMYDQLLALGIVTTPRLAVDFVYDGGARREAFVRRLVVILGLGVAGAGLLALGAWLWIRSLKHKIGLASAQMRRQEAKFKTLYESLEDLVLLEDGGGRIVEANARALKRLFGLSPEALRGQSPGQLGLELESSAQASDGPSNAVSVAPPGGESFWAQITVHELGGELAAPAVRFRVVRDVSGFVESRKALQESIADKNMLIKEVHHRVKNNLAVITGFLDLESRRAGDGATKDILAKTRARIMSMALLHELVYAERSLSALSAERYIERLVQGLCGIYDRPGLSWRFKAEASLSLSLDALMPLGLSICELVTNAIKHAFPGVEAPVLEVGLGAADGQALIYVEDNGPGLGAAAAENAGASLGFTVLESLASQLDGSFAALPNGPGLGGARFELRFPLPRAAS